MTRTVIGTEGEQAVDVVIYKKNDDGTYSAWDTKIDVNNEISFPTGDATLMKDKTITDIIDDGKLQVGGTVVVDESTLAKESGGNLATIAGQLDNKTSTLATSAKQDTGNTSLGSIKTNTDKLDANISTLATSAKQEYTKPLVPLQADETAATANTSPVTVTQAGILYADLANPSQVTMYVWFGAAPGAGTQIVLRPGASWNGNIGNAANMQYKSSATGGILDYVLRG